MLELATAQAKARRAPALGLYVHVPFCASTCDFCAFYQTKPTAEGMRGFLAGVAQEAELVVWERSVDTVFWGGGSFPPDWKAVFGWQMLAIMLVGVVFTAVRLRQEQFQREIDSLRRMAHAL